MAEHPLLAILRFASPLIAIGGVVVAVALPRHLPEPPVDDCAQLRERLVRAETRIDAHDTTTRGLAGEVAGMRAELAGFHADVSSQGVLLKTIQAAVERIETHQSGRAR